MSDRQTLAIPAATRTATRRCAASFPGRRDQIGLIRCLLAAFFDDCPAADDGVLLVSELAPTPSPIPLAASPAAA